MTFPNFKKADSLKKSFECRLEIKMLKVKMNLPFDVAANV